MAYKALIFGTDDIYPKLKPFYDAEIKRGIFEIVACIDDTSKVASLDNLPDFDFVIISAHKTLYQRIKQLEALGIARDKIIDGQVFKIPNLDFPRLLHEGIAYSTFEKRTFSARSFTIYPQVYDIAKGKLKLSLGTKSYIESNCNSTGRGSVYIGNFSCLAINLFFNLAITSDHQYKNVSLYSMTHSNFTFPKSWRAQSEACQINIGSDVWIGTSCVLKCTNPDKPLIIGDGAVIASDSVVVKNVPPYAIVGGNPAKIIKYRFPPDVIEALLRIRWWDWSLDKIHDNFKYFNDVDKFISMHDKG